MTVDAHPVRQLAFRLRPIGDWLREELAGARSRGELAVHYQPVVSLPDGEVAGAEALLRWAHPRLGAVAPAEFVPVAERTGLIHDLGSWVLRTAALAATRWPATASGRERAVAVNVSAVQLARPDVVDLVLGTLTDCALPPTRLAVEVTETATLADTASAARRLELLRAAGVRVLIDDFGTGYSLARLHALPADGVKIDRAFVGRLTTDPVSRAIVGGVVALAHSIGLEAVAEGVEHQAQLDILRDLGCDSAQGFLWSGALPAAAFAATLH